MKAITVRQPWAWAIAIGAKDVENRSWQRTYRGPVAIHAGLTDDAPAYLHPQVSAAFAEQFPLPPKWPTEADTAAFNQRLNGPVGKAWRAKGAVVAVADLRRICARSIPPYAPCCCGPWATAGQHHWQLHDVRLLNQPVPAHGAQGLWDLADQPDAHAAVLSQLATPGCVTAGCVGDCPACAAVLQAELAAHGLPPMTTGEPL